MQGNLTPLRFFFQKAPIIPAIRKMEHVDQAIAAQSKIVFFMTGDPENCESNIQRVLATGKLPIINIDLLNGFSRDKYAVNYLKRCGARGIISTHLDSLRHASTIGLYTIQRTFLVDSGALETITGQLKNTPIDALEALPAQVAPKLLARTKSIVPEIPVMGCGLIYTMKEVEALLSQGVSAVSSSSPQMWIR
jgi:glycerol uptake operon antiterminator